MVVHHIPPPSPRKSLDSHYTLCNIYIFCQFNTIVPFCQQKYFWNETWGSPEWQGDLAEKWPRDATSKPRFSCRWCNETEIKITDMSVLPVKAYLRQFDGDWPDTFVFYLRASPWLAFDVPYVRVFVLETITNSWTVLGTNPDGGEIFRTRPDRPWGLPSLCTMGTGSFPGVKRGAWLRPPIPSSTKVKERV